MLDTRLQRWDHVFDGEPIVTRGASMAGALARPAGHTQNLQRPEEVHGDTAMAWWGGEGAALVYAQEGDATHRRATRC